MPFLHLYTVYALIEEQTYPAWNTQKQYLGTDGGEWGGGSLL